MAPAARRLAGAARAVAPLCLGALAALAVLATVLAYVRGPGAFNSDNLIRCYAVEGYSACAIEAGSVVLGS